MDSPALVRTPRQVAELLGLSMPALRRHAATLEDVTGQVLPRGEHLERLWPEASVEALRTALACVHRQEFTSVGDALRAQLQPQSPLRS
ncbi:hypothetical protein [Deinococcus peraridilitoris]|uniref:HTH merR-type domain-containing protein n=1 Tax=Deinococcus peraridilitoris (strain DSM 19664 / LMG 22246 / CIP 109416 / KR-200) TaxID=937777 RepID=L0A1N5_DEIPD|nr:hypothetical protein [Deinococcus peraridilitoris]AFZ66925.1 hypothetical protein Deipe_1380 [Deinococcus peraridilitoris DSM 19664]